MRDGVRLTVAGLVVDLRLFCIRNALFSKSGAGKVLNRGRETNRQGVP